MTIQDSIQGYFGKCAGLEQLDSATYRLYAPFFHEDGDMYSIYITTAQNEIIVRDFGNTLMRVSYTFELDTAKKQETVSRIVRSNAGELDDGELLMRTSIEALPNTIFRFSQLVSKVSNIDILSRETVRTMFSEYLDSFVAEALSLYNVQREYAPTADPGLVVDYVIRGSRPLFLFGVNSDVKAAKVVISCLTFQKEGLPFRSVIVHDDIYGLTRFNQNQITNVADKQFVTLDDFKAQGPGYLQRELQTA